MKFKNILLIDDDADDQDIFLTAVNEISNEVKCLTLGSAVEALKQLESGGIHPEAIFLDLNMPVMSGQDFLIEIKKREQLKDIPVVIFTTSSHRITANMMMNLGAHDFITKPNKFDMLVEILKPFLN